MNSYYRSLNARTNRFKRAMQELEGNGYDYDLMADISHQYADGVYKRLSQIRAVASIENARKLAQESKDNAARIQAKMESTGLDFQTVLHRFPELRTGYTLDSGIWRNFAQEKADYSRKVEAITEAANGLKAQEIARTSARFEFESDEFQTREEKAERFINTGHISARY